MIMSIMRQQNREVVFFIENFAWLFLFLNADINRNTSTSVSLKQSQIQKHYNCQQNNNRSLTFLPTVQLTADLCLAVLSPKLLTLLTEFLCGRYRWLKWLILILLTTAAQIWKLDWNMAGLFYVQTFWEHFSWKLGAHSDMLMRTG